MNRRLGSDAVFVFLLASLAAVPATADKYTYGRRVYASQQFVAPYEFAAVGGYRGVRAAPLTSFGTVSLLGSPYVAGVAATSFPAGVPVVSSFGTAAAFGPTTAGYPAATLLHTSAFGAGQTILAPGYYSTVPLAPNSTASSESIAAERAAASAQAIQSVERAAKIEAKLQKLEKMVGIR